MTTYLTADELQRMPVLVPDSLTRAEVLIWIEVTRAAPPTRPGLEIEQALVESLFLGHLRPFVVDGGELRFDLTETGKSAVDARRAAASVQHRRDEDCTVGEDGCCTGCGVGHSGPACGACGGLAFHREHCSQIEAA